ncbi:MAG: hypothetical protein KJ634_11825 [Gammaproteobacteria bacterium]|nr:hypothetical protein [Gammaproteobacteria bacterium]MBU1416304.1 hypothetical protein [Gammaproteobacteria bacterium]
MHGLAIVCIAVLLLGNLAGCSSRQWYAAGQNYQRNQCERLPDMGERQRCLEKANMSYEEYEKERQSGSR